MEQPSVVIGIHGLENKPPRDEKRNWWRAALVEGLTRNRGIDGAGLSFEFVYWADLRYVAAGEPARYMAAWCNGATGIGLSRLRILRHYHDPALLRDAGAAVRATLRKGFGNNHCLCHGDLGSLELLLEASRGLGDPAWGRELSEQTSRVFASIEENGWICGLPLAVESPGLMEGIAGIGYGLLRLAAPDRVPSVMLLDPPSASISKPHYRERWELHEKHPELRTAALSEPRA